MVPLSASVLSPVSSPSKGLKRSREEDKHESASVEAVIEQCVAHVAEEAARSAQDEPSPVSAALDAVLAVVESMSVEPAPQTVVEERPIAPLPKRAGNKLRTAVTFLSGMAAAVVGMEAIGILAAFMDE